MEIKNLLNVNKDVSRYTVQIKLRVTQVPNGVSPT